MKKAIFVLSLVVAVIFAFAYRSEPIGYVTISCSDDNGAFYLVEDDLKLQSVTADGNILLELQLPKNEDGYGLSYDNISVNKDGVIYLLTTKRDDNGDAMAQWIDAYDRYGEYIDRFLYSEYAITGNYIFDQHMVGGLSAVSILETATNTLNVVSGSLVDGDTHEQRYIFDELPYFVTLEITERGEVFYTDLSGEIYCLNGEGEVVNHKIDLSEIGETVIVDIASGVDGNVYMYDAYGTRYLKYFVDSGGVEEIWGIGDLVYGDFSFEELGIPKRNGSTIYSLANPVGADSFYLASVRGDEVALTNSLIHGWVNVGFNGAIAFFVALLVFSLAFVVVRLRINTRKIWIKQIYAIAPLLVISIIFAVGGNYYSNLKLMANETRVQLYITCHEMLANLDGEIIEDLDLPLSYNSEIYDVFTQASSVNLQGFYEMYPDAIVKPIDREIYLSRDGYDYCVYRQSDNEGVYMLGYNTLYINSSGVSHSSNFEYSPDGTYCFYNEENADGRWTVCDMAILNSAGEKVGSVCASFDNSAYFSENRATYIINTLTSILFALGIFVALFLSIRRMLAGFDKLGEGVNLVAAGKWDTLVQIDSNDEMEDIANSFNIMARKIQSSFDATASMSMAYEKFVQREMMKILGKSNILEFKPGDYIVKEMNILSIFARNYQLVNCELTKEESFELANKLYAIYADVVGKKGGYIEAYSDGDMKVVFGGSTDVALDAILEIKEALLNQGLSAVNLRGVISRGNVMFGIVGDDNRMSTVTSTDVYAAVQQLNILANKYNIGVMLNQAAFEAVENKMRYECRYIGNVEKTSDNTSGLHIYDIIAGYDLSKQRERKLCKDIFEKGVRYYVAGELQLARACFIDVISVNHDDEVAKAYVFLCDRYKKDVGFDWQGNMV